MGLASRQAINPFDLPPAPDEDDAESDARDPVAEQVSTLRGLLEIMLADGTGDRHQDHQHDRPDREQRQPDGPRPERGRAARRAGLGSR